MKLLFSRHKVTMPNDSLQLPAKPGILKTENMGIVSIGAHGKDSGKRIPKERIRSYGFAFRGKQVLIG